MKKTLGILAVIIFFGINLFAGQSLVFSEKEKNLGLIEQHKDFFWNIKVKNVSDKPVTFTNIKTTCGCTMAKPDKKTVLPGEEINFKVRFNSEAFRGKVEKLVFIDTSNKERYVLRITAIVEEAVYLTPKRILVSTNDDSMEQLVEIKSFKNPENIKIEKIILPNTPALKYRKINDRSFVLEISPSKFKRDGMKIVTVAIKGVNHNLNLFINVRTPQLYTIYPNSTLLFLNIKKGKKLTKTITISSREKFNIVSSKTDLPYLKLISKKKISDKKWKVTVEFDSSKVNSLTGKTIARLKTDNGLLRDIKFNIVFHIIK